MAEAQKQLGVAYEYEGSPMYVSDKTVRGGYHSSIRLS